MSLSIKERLMTAQQVVASGFVSNGVEVKFDAEKGPYADLETRVVHLTPLPLDIDPKVEADVRGACDHELGRMLFTNPIPLAPFRQTTHDQTILAIAESIEGGRVDRALGNKWWGVRENLETTRTKALKKIRDQANPADKDNVIARTITALSLMAQGMNRAQAETAVKADIRPLMEFLAPILPQVQAVATTDDVVDLAREVKRLLDLPERPPEPPPPPKPSKSKGKPQKGDKKAPPQPGDGDAPKNEDKEECDPSKGAGDGEGDPGEGDGKTSTESKDESEGAGEGDATPKDEEGEGEGEEKGDEQGSPGMGAEPDDDACKDAKDPVENPLTGMAGYGSDGTLPDAIHKNAVANIRRNMMDGKKITPKNSYSACTDQDLYETIDAKVPAAQSRDFYEGTRALVPLLQRKIQMEFNAPTPVYSRHKRKGKIDARSLWKVATGAETLFKQKAPKLQVNSDLMLLIDDSGSMKGEKVNLAAKCAALFSQVLELVGVRNEVLAFTTTHPRHAIPKATMVAYARVEPLHHITVKQVTQRFQAAADNFVWLGQGNIGGNYNIDGEAVIWAAQRLCEFQNKGSKKALIVFSDGYPAGQCNVGADGLRGHLQEMVKKVEKAGIPVIGVGIHSNAVKEFYPRHVVIENLSEMATTFLTILRDVLREGARVVG